MIDIFYPLGGVSAWDDNELRYSLRSIETNLLSPYHVTIYSDHPLEWIQNTTFRIMERYLPEGKTDRNFENYFDTLNKIHTFALNSNCPDFIYMYDDCCLIKPMGNLSLMENVALQEETTDLASMRKDKHGQTVLKALQMCGKSHAFNYETHLPRIYDRILLLRLFDTFDILSQDIPPALSTLYHNYYYDKPNLMLTSGAPFRATFAFEDDPQTGCYLASNIGEITDACRGKIFLHYSDAGLRFSPNGQPILKNYLTQLFPNKSKHESDN